MMSVVNGYPATALCFDIFILADILRLFMILPRFHDEPSYVTGSSAFRDLHSLMSVLVHWVHSRPANQTMNTFHHASHCFCGSLSFIIGSMKTV
jgi:hypothetical protein